jgi:hypothetical protein
MSLRKSRPKFSPLHFFVKIDIELAPWKNVAQKFALFLQLAQKLPMGENSPNLVTLL